VASRAHVRHILAAYTGTSPGAVAFEMRVGGKLQLAGGGPIRCNWTNTGELGLCAVGPDREVGVDAEEVSAVHDALEIGERFFAPVERAALREAAPETRNELFARIWTLKEAYTKAIGVGLSAELTHFDVLRWPGCPALLQPGALPTPGVCRLRELRPCARYAAAVAVEGDTEVEVQAWAWGGEPPEAGMTRFGGRSVPTDSARSPKGWIQDRPATLRGRGEVEKRTRNVY